MNNNETAALYARISIQDQNVPKVENQLAELRKLAKARGYTSCIEYDDDGISASTGEHRPDYDRLLGDLAAGRVSVIFATEEARLCRNELEKAELGVLCVKAGASWETVRDGAVDPATASGALMAAVRGAIDAFESRRKAERQRSANAHRRNNGQHATTCPKPFGWQDDRVTLNDEQAELIRTGTEMILAGKTMYAVVQAFRASGVKPPRAAAWGRASVQNMLTRWRNAGIVSHEDEPLGAGDWEVIVPRAQLESVRAILTTRGTGTGRLPQRLCTGIARCLCGSPMVASGANGKTSYQCGTRVRGTSAPGSKHTGIAAHLLDPLARQAVIDSYFLMPRMVNSADAEAINLAELHRELTTVRDHLDKLVDLHLGGSVSKAVFEKKNRPLATREAELVESIAVAERASAHAAMLTRSRAALFSSRRINLRAAAEAKRELGRVFDSLAIEDQRRLLAATATITVGVGIGTGRVAITGPALPVDEEDDE